MNTSGPAAALLQRERAHSRDRIPALRSEVAATQAKLERLRVALSNRQSKLNRLLAQDALAGSSVSAHTGDA